jgi:hypothetical protein
MPAPSADGGAGPHGRRKKGIVRKEEIARKEGFEWLTERKSLFWMERVFGYCMDGRVWLTERKDLKDRRREEGSRRREKDCGGSARE